MDSTLSWKQPVLKFQSNNFQTHSLTTSRSMPYLLKFFFTKQSELVYNKTLAVKNTFLNLIFPNREFVKKFNSIIPFDTYILEIRKQKLRT